MFVENVDDLGKVRQRTDQPASFAKIGDGDALGSRFDSEAPPTLTSRTLRIDNLSVGIGTPAVGCRGSRSVDSIVDGNAVQAAIIGCPQSSDCCPPSVGIRVRVASDSACWPHSGSY